MNEAKRFLSRRKLLFALGGAASVAGAAMIKPIRAVLARNLRQAVARQPLLRRVLLSLANAGYDEWMDLVGSSFTIGGGTILQLVGVVASGSGGARPVGLTRDRAFIAHFDVLYGQTMAGDLIYVATHQQYGPLQIFLSASTDPRTPRRMMAVFN
ncbi:MAG: hypothetical protein QOG13_3290 [Sphingomonadales bacterium]|jgi:hypothetical protein|nr:hypothetical protein [Sphingomonadales bacterium]MEA3045640.1 hypothetical protein [Sphingomonadales bacterium]